MVLESLAVLNASYATIKAAVENGRELTSVSKQIMSFATAKQDIEREHQKKKNGFFGNKQDNDLETFLHLEEIREKEKQLKEVFMYFGRAGCWDDYQRHCAQARKARAEAEKKRKQQMDDLIAGICIAILIGLGISVIAGIVWLVTLSHKY